MFSIPKIRSTTVNIWSTTVNGMVDNLVMVYIQNIPRGTTDPEIDSVN